jgi:hypothetical protein
VTAGTHGVFVEVAVELTGDVFQTFLFPIFVQINLVVLPLTFVVLTTPILVQALPEVAANVLELENENNMSAATKTLENFDIGQTVSRMKYGEFASAGNPEICQNHLCAAPIRSDRCFFKQTVSR